MKRTIQILALLIIVPFIANFTQPGEGENSEKAKATSWSIDKAHSNVTFSVTHFFTPVNGTFDDYNGEIYFDPNNLEESSVDVEIMISSIDTKNQKRDNHLQSDDFFHAEKYPKITFKSDKIEKTGEKKYVAHGTLSMRGHSKKIELPFTHLGTTNHPMKKNTVVTGIKAETSLSRTAYDVGVGDWASNAVIGDDVDVSIAMELHSKK